MHTAENMTTLRHFALDIIKSDTKRKLGVANARKRAGWDRNYLIELLKGAGCPGLGAGHIGRERIVWAGYGAMRGSGRTCIGC